MKTYQITNRRTSNTLRHEMQAGDVETIRLDLSGWSVDNGNVTSATWTLLSGSVSLGTPALAGNVASCVITASQRTHARIRVTLTNGTNTRSVTILIRAIEPIGLPEYDYGWLAA